MQISLVPCADDSGASEWVLIEFQGEIESNTTDMTGLPLGQLSFKAPVRFLVFQYVFGAKISSMQGVPLLVIGHHRLEGKEEKLKKPFVVTGAHHPSGR